MSDGTKQVFTGCRYCMALCGVEVTVDTATNRVVRVAPDKGNPHTWQDFCANARTAAEMVNHPRRITAPMKRVGDRYVETTYEEAVADISARLGTIIDRYGPDAVGSYHGNPSAFSWGNSVLFAGLLDAIGTKNRFWVGSIDQNAAHVVAQKLFGSELVSLQLDIDASDCMVFIGHNPAESSMNWYWSSPGGWRRALARRDGGADLIVVDPRRTETAAKATLHVAIRPGQDWAFLLGVLKVVFDKGWDRPATAVPVTGVDGLRSLAAAADLDDLSARCDVPADVIADVARRFATARTAFCATATGVGQTRTGTVAEWLGMVLNAVTDRLDKPGGRRYERGIVDMAKLFSLMAPPGEHRTRLRGTPMVAGYHSLPELADEITTPGPGQIRAVILNAGNPVVSGPQGAALDAALGQLDLLVAVDLVQRESHRHADWLIPGSHWLERSEAHPILVGFHDAPFAQFWPAAIDRPAGMQEEWEFFTDLALAMRRNLFGKPGVNRIVQATRTLARRTGRPGLAFHPDRGARLVMAVGRRVSGKDVVSRPHGLVYGQRRFGDLAKALRTPGKTINLADEDLLAAAHRLLAEPPVTAPADYPFHLNNRRRNFGMNSWLNDLPTLADRQPTNRAEIHPDDAARLGIGDGDLVEISSPVGSIEVAALVTDAVRPGSVCVDHGFGSRVFDPSGGEQPAGVGANRNLLIDNRAVDPLSGTAAFNDRFVAVRTAQRVSGE
jgi:formate dehydrogenase